MEVSALEWKNRGSSFFRRALNSSGLKKKPWIADRRQEASARKELSKPLLTALFPACLFFRGLALAVSIPCQVNIPFGHFQFSGKSSFG